MAGGRDAAAAAPPGTERCARTPGFGLQFGAPINQARRVDRVDRADRVDQRSRDDYVRRHAVKTWENTAR
jgi:hypothetical protein